MKIMTVLRSGGEYAPVHVEALRRQCAKHAPEADFYCLSDMDAPGRIPLRHDWPGWWSKMELFRPDIRGDFLYMDLDTILLDDITPLFRGRLTILQDFYRRKGLQSSLMFLPESQRGKVWRRWIESPEVWMDKNRRGGDQTFLEGLYPDADRWQNVTGGIYSYKVHAREQLPGDARVIVFHGTPRPWKARNEWARAVYAA